MQHQELSYVLNNELIDLNSKQIGSNVKVSMEVFSLENVYTIPFGSYKVKDNHFHSDYLVWGDTEKVSGMVDLTIEKTIEGSIIHASAELDRNIRAIKIKFDNLPLGKLISMTDMDRKVTEQGLVYKYPEGWRSMSHPFLVFKITNNKYLYIRCLDKTVTQKNFFIKKKGETMYIDVVQEVDGTKVSNKFAIPNIEIGITDDKEKIYDKQSEYMMETYNLVPFEQNKNVPDWFREVSLVVIMNMESFTGHIFHTYQQAFEDVKKLCEMIPAKRILVYFAGWEGRYYYKYGNYYPDDRLGGPKGLKKCIDGIKKLGCHTIAMFGMNMVNKNALPVKDFYEEAEFESISGSKFHNGSVNWEGAHHYDFGQLVNLNIANQKWADCLFNQIRDNTDKYGFDGVFLDIAACYVNDKNFSLFNGVCEFCDRLRTIKKDFLVTGEGYYDGLSKAMPVFQSGHTDGALHFHDRVSEKIFTNFSREFAHLCLGDPSVGSSGVHELGYNTDWRIPVRKGLIPSISLTNNSLEKGEERVKEIIKDSLKYAKKYLE